MKNLYGKTRTAMLLLSVAVCFFPAFADGQDDSLNDARAAGVKYLLSRIAPSGACLDEPRDPSSPEYGLRTATAVCALLSLDVNPDDAPELRRAAKWLLKFNPQTTAPLAMRIMALCRLKQNESLPAARSDVKKLVSFAYADGGFGPASAAGQPRQPGDDCNNQSTSLATLAFDAARQKNIDVPIETWRKLNAYWLAQQEPSGGFSWTKYRGTSKELANPYGSMTAAGVVGAYLSYSAIRVASLTDAEEIDVANDRAITTGVNWIVTHLDFDFNPNKGAEWYYQWLEQLAMMSRLTGYRRSVQHGINERLLSTQNGDGSWGDGDRILQTCSALGALAKSGGLVLINKLRFPGKWNTHFDDARNIIGWLEYMYELPMDWQVVDLDRASLWDCTGRVCYLSGKGRVDFNRHHVQVLRDFINRGGILLSESAGGDGEFSLSVQRLYQQLFPTVRRQMLSADTPLLNLKFKLAQPSELFGLSNGVRLLAVHAPHGVSWELEKNQFLREKSSFEFFANLLFYLYPNPVKDYRPLKGAFPHGRIIYKLDVAMPRIKFAGNFDPEPYALQYFDDFFFEKTKKHIGRGYNFVTFEELDASKYKVAVLSGTGEFPPLNEKEMLKVQQYLIDGGTIIADAAGSDETFARTFTRNFMEKLGKPKPFTAPQKPAKLSAGYELSAIYMDDRAAVIFSPVDIQSGLVGYSLTGLISWDGDSASLLCNLVEQSNTKTTKMSHKSKK